MYTNNKYKKKDINIGIGVLRLFTLVLTLMVFVKLFIICYVQASEFTKLANYQTSITTPIALPRGEVFDSRGKLVVGNEEHKSLAYIESGVLTSEKKIELAESIAKNINISDVYVSDDDVRDLWLNTNKNYIEILDNFSEEETKEYEELPDSAAQTEYLRKFVTDDIVQSAYTTYGKNAIYVMLKMNQATSKTPVIIEQDLTLDEQYIIETHANEIGGFYVTPTYTRTYPYGQTLSSFIGTVGPIPEEDISYYEARGYAQNEIVGTSYMEEELEPVLHATPATETMYFDENGNIVSNKITNPGKAGYDVNLTIDMELQKIADKDSTHYLKTDNDFYLTHQTCTAAVDPRNGNLLYTSGILEDGKNYYDYSTCSFTSAMEIGSIAKPANLLMLFDQGVYKHGEEILDAPMYFQGSPPKASYFNMGTIDDADAIALSSNVYFYKGFLKLIGQPYVKDMAVNVKSSDFELVRKYLSEFGLSVSTGIDMPYENTGLRGDGTLPGFFLDLANGQYDTYTTLQTAQYVATIANGGTRYKINYIQSINQPGGTGVAGAIVYQPEPVILNELTMSDDDIKRVREDMKGGTDRADGSSHDYLYSLVSKYDFESGSKTGTAESFYYPGDGTAVQANNSTSLSFGPFDNPTIATGTGVPMYGTNILVNTNAGWLNGQILDDYLKYEEGLDD